MIAWLYLGGIVVGCSSASVAPLDQDNSTQKTDSLIYVTDSSFWYQTSPCEFLELLKDNSRNIYVLVTFPDSTWFQSPDTTCFARYLAEYNPSAAFVSAYSSVGYNDLNRTISAQTTMLRQALRRGKFLHSPG